MHNATTFRNPLYCRGFLVLFDILFPMKRFIELFWNSDGVPRGVRTLTTVTSIRWIGWGFAESLIPIFLFSFGNSYAQAGLLQSSYTITLILALPILGIAADRIRASTLVLIGLCLYIFIGASYLMAGITGMVIYVVIARLINGVALGMDSIGRETYFRRNVPLSRVATAFGYQDSIANFWWMAASLSGIILIQFFPVHQLLFMITPMTLVAILVLVRFRKKDDSEVRRKNTTDIATAVTIKNSGSWSWALRGLVTTSFFLSFAGSVIAFFVPIQAYNEGTNLGLVIIMGVVVTLPTLFGLGFGKLFDKKGRKVFAYGIMAFALLTLCLAFFQTYIWQLVIVFLIAVIQEFLGVGYQELVTVHAPPEHLGKTTGILRSIANIGTMAGPFVVGSMMDIWGTRVSYFSLGILIGVLGIMFWLLQTRASRVLETQAEVMAKI